MRLYTCVCVCVCMFVHRLWVLLSVLQRVDGVMRFTGVFVCIFMRMHVCVGSEVKIACIIARKEIM